MSSSKWIKPLAAYVFFIFLYFVLTRFSDFSSRQSRTLIILLLLGMGYAHYLAALENAKNTATQPAPKFLPYRVRVEPKWHELLADFKLIDDSQDWEQIQASLWKVLPYGFLFTILQQSQESSRDADRLIYCDYRESFGSEVDFQEAMNPIRANGIGVNIFMEWNTDGYDLGIEVDERWWERVKSSCPKPLDERGGKYWPLEKLIVATISEREFGTYWQREWAIDSILGRHGPGPTFKEWSQQVEQLRDAERSRNGWSKSQVIHAPGAIEHKYFSLAHSSI